MPVKNVIKAEMYKLIHFKLVWCMPVLFSVIGYICAKSEFTEFYMYKELELFVCPSFMSMYLGFLVVLVTGYAIGVDFSQRTIQNALVAGVDRRKYYFVRLAVQFIIVAVLVSVSMWVNCICRVFDATQYSNYSMEVFGVKFAAYMGIVFLQYFAIVAFTYMLCFFFKNQLVSIIIGLFVLYGELVIRTLFKWNNIHFADKVFNYMPIGALEDMWVCATKNRILEINFLKYGISAGVMIAVFGLAGYFKFRNDECKGEE